jgi:hypothetical protein
MIIAAGSVPFEHGVLGMVAVATLAVPEAFADFEDFPCTLRKELFVVELRRSTQPPVAGRFGVDVQLHTRRFHPNRSFDFDKPFGMKKRPDALHQGVTFFQCLERGHQAFETRS